MFLCPHPRDIPALPAAPVALWAEFPWWAAPTPLGFTARTYMHLRDHIRTPTCKILFLLFGTNAHTSSKRHINRTSGAVLAVSWPPMVQALHLPQKKRTAQRSSWPSTSMHTNRVIQQPKIPPKRAHNTTHKHPNVKSGGLFWFDMAIYTN